MRSTLVVIGTVLAFGGGACVASLLVTYRDAGVHIFNPLTIVQIQSAPLVELFACTVVSVDVNSRTVNCALRDRYTQHDQITITAHYDQATSFNGIRFDGLHAGTRVLALLSRTQGPFYLVGMTNSTQYE